MIERVGTPAVALSAAWRDAFEGVRARRGGARYLVDLLEGAEPDAALDAFAAAGELWCDDVSSLLVVRRQVIVALYVAPANRRRGRGRALVSFARTGEPQARDALALPGDRATKALYESVGWKARLLTLGDE